MILSAPLEQTEQLTVSVVSLRTGQPGSTYEIEGFFVSRKEPNLTKRLAIKRDRSESIYEICEVIRKASPDMELCLVPHT